MCGPYSLSLSLTYTSHHWSTHHHHLPLLSVASQSSNIRDIKSPTRPDSTILLHRCIDFVFSGSRTTPMFTLPTLQPRFAQHNCLAKHYHFHSGRSLQCRVVAVAAAAAAHVGLMRSILFLVVLMAVLTVRAATLVAM